MVKKPHPERVNDLLVRKVFQEADVLSQLHHPNIVMLMAICNGPSQEDVCIVLELMKRATLDYQLHERRRKFSVYEILVMLAGVADGIYGSCLSMCLLSVGPCLPACLPALSFCLSVSIHLCQISNSNTNTCILFLLCTNLIVFTVSIRHPFCPLFWLCPQLSQTREHPNRL
jgi:serine/threonine protein kinase